MTRARHKTAQSHHSHDRLLVALCLLLVTLGLGLMGWPSTMAAVNDTRQVHVSASVEHLALHATQQLKQAEAYNAKLADGQGVIGETADPYGNPHGDFSFSKDRVYQSTLNMGGGVMGVLKIPKISVDLPIRHGADQTVLANGVGHLHGTSLPVGGSSTHAVLTGHRGLEDATLFTRLDELKVGDPIYVNVMGRIIAYKVDRVYPYLTPAEAMSKLRIIKGEDRLTLLTCTPIFVNSHRLMVSAVRADMPDVVPYPADAPHDERSWLSRYGMALAAYPPLVAFLSTLALPSNRYARRYGLHCRNR